MTDGQAERELTRQEMWDERHAAREPVESPDPDLVLAEVAGARTPGTALDLGTGDGRNAVWLATQGWRVTAVDFSRVALERARGLADRVGVTVTWELRDLSTWSPPPLSFDLVGLFFIQLPPDEREIVYGAAARSVAPGGSLVVVAHHPENLERGAPGPKSPEVLFTADDLARDLAGFDVVRADAVERVRDDGLVAVDTVLHAVRRAG